MTCEDWIADSIRASHPNWPVKRGVAELNRRMRTECPNEYDHERSRKKASKGRRRKAKRTWGGTEYDYRGPKRRSATKRPRKAAACRDR